MAAWNRSWNPLQAFFGTLNLVTVFQYCNQFKFTDCLQARCSGSTARMYFLYLQWYYLVYVPCDQMHQKDTDLSATISLEIYQGQLPIAQLCDTKLYSGCYVEKLWDPGGICWSQFMSSLESSHFMVLEHHLTCCTQQL